MTSSQQSESQGGLRRLYATLWRYAEGRRVHFVTALGMLGLAQAIRLTIPYSFGAAVNALQKTEAQDIRGAATWLSLMLGAAILAWALHGPARVLERRTALQARERLADALYAKAVSLPLAWHEAHHSGDIIHRVRTTTTALYGFTQNQFIYLQNLVSIVGPIAALVALSPVTGGTAFFGYALIAMLLLRFDRVMVRLVREENRADRQYNAALIDCLGNISTVLTLRLGEATRRMVRSKHLEVSAPVRKSIVVNEAKWGAVDLLNNAMRTGLIALYGWLAWRESGVLLVGTLVMVHSYAQQIGSVVGAMAGHWGELVRQQTDIASADEIFDASERLGRDARVPEGWREICVDGLSFTHARRNGEGKSLDDVSLVLRRGERVALVGESGSGKSTLLRVLLGLYEPERARFVVDGEERPDLVDLGGLATLVPQDPEVFEASVGHNVTLGIDYSPFEVQRAAELACLAPVLQRLGGGLDAAVSERGGNLSGGQRQRLALARGLLACKRSSLVLLDEPTSSIDPVTEMRIYDALFAELSGACVVSSIHRLHLLDRFDRVVWMEDGRVVDTGALDELLARQPRFRELYRAARREEPLIAAA